jgi:asparagine synthase (glutamine-hydrolysing)
MSHLTDADREALRALVDDDHLLELGESFRAAGALDPRNRQLCADTETYLPHQLLSLLDRTTMAASIEGRVPFLDHRVAELALSIHGDHKFGDKHQNKLLLRRLASRWLPADVATRKKHGFPNAVTRWLAPASLPAIRAQLMDRGTFVASTLPEPWLAGLLASPEALRHNALTVHSLLVIESWHRVFCRDGSRKGAATAAAHSTDRR